MVGDKSFGILELGELTLVKIETEKLGDLSFRLKMWVVKAFDFRIELQSQVRFGLFELVSEVMRYFSETLFQRDPNDFFRFKEKRITPEKEVWLEHANIVELLGQCYCKIVRVSNM